MKTKKLKTVEGAIIDENPAVKKTAAKAFKKGVAAAKEAAVSVAVSPVKLASHAVYGVCYGLAYVAVYSALVIGKVFPEKSAVHKGLHEGLETAVKDFDAKHQEVIVDTADTVSANIINA